MQHFVRKSWILICVCFLLIIPVSAATTLIPGGQVIGLQLQDNTVTVAGLEDPSCGLQVGDRLTKIDGQPIRSVSDIRWAVSRCDDAVRLTVLRQGKTKNLRLTPKETTQGKKLGVFLRQGTAGIGTVTYYNPENNTFGALGHGVCNPDGTLTSMETGKIFDAAIQSVQPGKPGTPGKLMGAVQSPNPTGTIAANTHQGIFGKTDPIRDEALPVAKISEIQKGNATIYATVAGNTRQAYSVEILKIYPNGTPTRNMLIQVTDPALLATTGGITQGMSGSPIIQNGKLIGPVTHVLVNDPTTGYGIFIENMLDAAA